VTVHFCERDANFNAGARYGATVEDDNKNGSGDTAPKREDRVEKDRTREGLGESESE